jgi:hypothetical protein
MNPIEEQRESLGSLYETSRRAVNATLVARSLVNLLCLHSVKMTKVHARQFVSKPA